ncbi:hypothetical protein EMIHUDRAFT_226468 [Emiliania huxleyi CCMP1516]|uniref:HECT-type E3 ubiquitin transferase n=2 Tax=Emiliania huxleyi TaxID=2903 RepID=A0A0D3KKY7_EMIH1|nr:hypothetical protein EMIHUDRAFT_226468 [Emiliania huxleyi CCMP1516]EOD36422.1 hypothetical protein EMIHUDRAFT_226468 [Emiliania huxleyi CCMP1516]|eukprot:XP_005788851.1 hypothetical protein EMIHUDRAFT_226468 [Emiliania huxleyi CCMP1516]
MPGESFQTTREAVAQASRRQETVERARAAREARAQAAAAAAKVEADQRDANAAEVVQCGARRWLESIRSRTSQRAAWVCPDHPPPAGQQLALAAWLLRFYEPRHDGGRLSQLCRLILAGLEEGAEAERAFCAAALSRPLTRHWVAVLHRLLLACARQLTPVGGALPAAGEGEGKGGEVVSGVLGPPLRLLLALAEPELFALGVLSLPALCEPSAALLPPAVLETLRRGDAVWKKLKGTIRVEFVSELGLAEAGIDRTGVCKEPLEDAAGVFKEFLEDAMRAAIDAQRGLFARTAQRRIYPSPSSGVAELLGKAVYEGIVLDAALADFFAAKLLGKPGSIDDLASLDPELFQSLQLVKSYDGDVEGDLCLCFTVDEDVFGVRTAVDLREGGSTMPVTRENRIE